MLARAKDYVRSKKIRVRFGLIFLALLFPQILIDSCHLVTHKSQWISVGTLIFSTIKFVIKKRAEVSVRKTHNLINKLQVYKIK